MKKKKKEKFDWRTRLLATVAKDNRLAKKGDKFTALANFKYENEMVQFVIPSATAISLSISNKNF